MVVLAGLLVVAAPVRTADRDLMDTAAFRGLTVLSVLVQAAGLGDLLRGPAPVTLFAPTDRAFADLPEGVLDNLLRPTNRARLRRMLTYHVVRGEVRSAEIVKLGSAQTVEGDRLTVRNSAAGLMVDGAHVTQADVEASNGVIHVIDKVLLPPVRLKPASGRWRVLGSPGQ